MKALVISLFLILGVSTGKAQEQTISTKSVAIQDLINFVAKNYIQQTENDIDHYNLTFSIQVANGNLATEDLVILKQAFKLMSERLNNNNKVSIVTYFGYSGVSLKTTSVDELEAINEALSNLKESIESFEKDGIDLAYKIAKENYDENAQNAIIIIRNRKASNADTSKMSLKEQKKLKRKKRNKVLLSTAIGLLPELIALLDK